MSHSIELKDYLEVEKELAERLFPHCEVREQKDGWFLEKPNGQNEDVPRWTRDWRDCGPLMVQHDILWDSPTGQMVQAWSSYRAGVGLTHIEDHLDKDAAVRYAIVKAVIAKLRLDSDSDGEKDAETTARN